MEQRIFYNIYDTPVGPVTIAENGSALTHLLFHEKGESAVEGIRQQTELLANAYRQLGEYFSGRRREFSLALAPHGTAFQRQVWNALCTIPYGETMCYSQIACIAGNPKASRAVGMANHNNPISIIIPCHRVIGKDGSLTGYGGGLHIKQFLLDLERT